MHFSVVNPRDMRFIHYHLKSGDKTMTTELNTMSRKDLTKLRADIDKALTGMADRERKSALEAAERAAAEHGFSLAELTGIAGTKGQGRKAKGAAKYRNPSNPEQTWSGKGRRPNWINEADAAGRAISDFLI